jgi:hypothetical protein
MVVRVGKDLVADFMSLALMESGVMVGPNFWARRAAAPATMGAAMLRATEFDKGSCCCCSLPGDV